MFARSHVLGSEHSVFSFCLRPRFGSRFFVSRGVQSCSFGVKWFSFWWLRFVTGQQAKRCLCTVPATFKHSAPVLVLPSCMAYVDADRFINCCTMPSTLKCQGACGEVLCPSRWSPEITSSMAFDKHAPSGSSRTSIGHGRLRIQPSINARRHSPMLLWPVSLCNVSSRTPTITQSEP